MVVSMVQRKKYKGVGGFNVPIVVVRTPEQHRSIIQPVQAAELNRTTPKPRKSRTKRVRLAKAGNGTSSLSARMLALGYRTYSHYLASPHWLDVKQRWKAGNLFKGWVCHSFGCDGREGLSLHHWTYERIGREDLNDLILVCRDCHTKIHALERRGMPLDEATKKITKPMAERRHTELGQPNPFK